MQGLKPFLIGISAVLIEMDHLWLDSRARSAKQFREIKGLET
jgi:hypothetical protein